MWCPRWPRDIPDDWCCTVYCTKSVSVLADQFWKDDALDLPTSWTAGGQS